MSAILRFPLALPLLIYQSAALALSQIWANKVRAILTTLGILIGVAAVSAVIALIDGMKNRVLSEFEAYGTNKIFIHPHWRKTDIGRGAWRKIVFKNNLFDELLERCPSVESFTRDAGYGGMPTSFGSQTAGDDDKLEFHGVDPAWHRIERRGPVSGRGITPLDSEQIRRVCVINEVLRDKLHMDRDPTGQVVEVEYFGRLMVVGMIDQPVAMMGGDADTSEIYVPFTYTTSRYNWPTWYNVTAITKSRDEVEEAKAEIEFFMRQVRRLKPTEEANFRVETAARAVDEISQLAGTLTTIAGGIVAVSLLVGGIGIMNIMLVSVSERTREIGLRKAVGARPGAILLQFLVESIVLCLLGGLLGLIVGQALTTGVSHFLPADPNQMLRFDPFDEDVSQKVAATNSGIGFILPPAAIAIAFTFSAVVGVVFGMFPAIKAAMLDPIEALRHE
jgi:putative ABC transport system permease protein